MDINNPTIVLVGGSGQIATLVGPILVNTGHQVVVVDKIKPKYQCHQFCQVNLAKAHPSRILPRSLRQQPLVICNFAMVPTRKDGNNGKWHEDCLELNEELAIKVLEGCQNMDNIVCSYLMSTLSVFQLGRYRDDPSLIMPENCVGLMSTVETDPYGFSKRLQECQYRNANIVGKMRTAVIRISTPKQSAWAADGSPAYFYALSVNDFRSGMMQILTNGSHPDKFTIYHLDSIGKRCSIANSRARGFEPEIPPHPAKD